MIESIFSNHWWMAVASNYSVMFAVCLATATFILKLVAIYKPDVPSNQIIDLLKGTVKEVTDVTKGEAIEPK
jgi:hypothetical protein